MKGSNIINKISLKMLNLIKCKILILLILSLIITSCNTTGLMWDSDTQSDEIRAFFIDKENQKVVFIGVYDYMLNKEDHYHYSLKDPTNTLMKVADIGLKYGKEYYLIMHAVGTRGKHVWGNDLKFTIYLKDDLDENTKKEIKDILKQVMGIYYDDNRKYDSVFVFFNHGNKQFHPFNNIMTRYPSKKEKFTNFCKDDNYYKYIEAKTYEEINNFKDSNSNNNNSNNNNTKSNINNNSSSLESNKESSKEINKDDCVKVIPLTESWKGMVGTYNSNTQILYKTALTPVTLAFDIASAPFYLVTIILAGIGMSSNVNKNTKK